MSLTFGIITTFDHTQQTWRTFKGRITQWFIANEIDTAKDPEGVKRRAILLSALTEGTYRLAADLAQPKTLEAVPYEDIVQLLDTHFTPKQVGFGERHNFYAAAQWPTETASQWAARLRGLTARCNFYNVEEALRDRFIMGMQPGVEKEKLYVQNLAGLTLAKAVELVENLRSARAAATAGAAAATSAVGAAAEQELYKIERKKVKCSVCGYSNHETRECRFANYTCKKCNVKGHLRRMCKSVKYVQKDEVSEGDDDDDNYTQLWDVTELMTAQEGNETSRDITSSPPPTVTLSTNETGSARAREEMMESPPSWVTSTRGVQQTTLATGNGADVTVSPSTVEGSQQDMPSSPAWVTTSRGVRRPASSDDNDEFYETSDGDDPSILSQSETLESSHS